MPELPDILIYIEHLHKRLLDQRLVNIRISTPFLLRTAEPSLTCLLGQTIIGIERLGKRIVFVFPDEFYLVLHLMIAGRLHWREANCKIQIGRASCRERV